MRAQQPAARLFAPYHFRPPLLPIPSDARRVFGQRPLKSTFHRRIRTEIRPSAIRGRALAPLQGTLGACRRRVVRTTGGRLVPHVELGGDDSRHMKAKEAFRVTFEL